MLKELRGTDYKSLIKFRIRKILMICSNYDAFILEEDGQIESQIYREYIDLNLSNPPQFIWVQTSAQAREILNTVVGIDMVMCLYNVGDKEIFTLASELKHEGRSLPFVLLTHFSKEVYRRLALMDTSAIDYMFSWHGNADLIVAIVKLFEDKMNAEHDILGVGVQAILLVEDSVRYYSTYLPELYKMLIKQSAEFLKETLNLQQKKFRKRSRPKILLATNLDDAMSMYSKYKSNLLGVISDVGFTVHKGDKPEDEKLDAGIDVLLDGAFLQKACKNVCLFRQGSIGLVSAHNDARRIQIVIKSLRLTKELWREQDILSAEVLAGSLSKSHRDGRLDHHHSIRIHLQNLADDSLHRRSVKEILLGIIIGRSSYHHKLRIPISSFRIQSRLQIKLILSKIFLDIFILDRRPPCVDHRHLLRHDIHSCHAVVLSNECRQRKSDISSSRNCNLHNEIIKSYKNTKLCIILTIFGAQNLKLSMTLAQQQYLELLRAGLWSKSADQSLFQGEVDWKAILRTSHQQTTNIIVADGIDTLPPSLCPPKKRIFKLAIRRTENTLMHNLLNTTLNQAVQALNAEGIWSILLKGQGVANNYINPQSRMCGDSGFKCNLVAKSYVISVDKC